MNKVYAYNYSATMLARAPTSHALQRALEQLETIHANAIKALGDKEEVTVTDIQDFITNAVAKLHADARNTFGSARVLRDLEGPDIDRTVDLRHVLGIYSKTRKTWKIYGQWLVRTFPVLRNVLPVTTASHDIVSRLVVLTMAASPSTCIRLHLSPPGHVYSPTGRLFVCESD